MHVVIVGGSFGAISAFQHFSRSYEIKSLKVTMVSEKKVFCYHPGALRASASTKNSAYAAQIQLPLEKLITHENTHIIISRVTHIYASSIKLETGEKIDFDYLIIATGTMLTKSYPGSATDFPSTYNVIAKAVDSSESILIVGGGVIGCELAGEIKNIHRNKTVQIVHSGKELCSSMVGVSPEFRSSLKRKLQSLDILVICNERVDLYELNSEGWSKGYRTLKTSAGTELSSDLQTCTGIALNDAGRILVNEKLKVEGNRRIYAVGDVAEFPPSLLSHGRTNGKFAYRAMTMGVSAAQNILLEHSKSSPVDYTGIKYFGPLLWKSDKNTEPYDFVMMALGKHHGITQLPYCGYILGNWATRVKCHDVFLYKTLWDLSIKQ